jgi:hypothetical protein
MKRIQKGPVRGISFKLQEEERERKDQYVPEVSALDTSVNVLEIDPDTKVLCQLASWPTFLTLILPGSFAIAKLRPHSGQHCCTGHRCSRAFWPSSTAERARLWPMSTYRAGKTVSAHWFSGGALLGCLFLYAPSCHSRCTCIHVLNGICEKRHLRVIWMCTSKFAVAPGLGPRKVCTIFHVLNVKCSSPANPA